MKIFRKFARFAVVCILLFSIMISPDSLYHTAAEAESKMLSLYADSMEFEVGGQRYPLSEEILLYYSNVFIPLDDILPKCGFTLGWDNSICATVAVKDNVESYIIMNSPVVWIGPVRHEYDLPTMIYRGKAYMSLAMFTDLTQYYVTLEGSLQETPFNKRDLLQNTYVTDEYRLPYENISYGNGVTMAGNFAFERVGISGESAVLYAGVVNEVASKLPGVSVYNIVVPTSGEFYAPKEMNPYQTDGIKTIYQNLSSNVMPINAVAPLMEHASEKIYFSTDHHWTQRGAYYVYKAFAENKGMDVVPLSEFVQYNSETHVGSFANFTKGTPLKDVISANPELLERFMPRSETAGCAYSDMYMRKKIKDVVPVSKSYNSYSCFIGGDNPLTVMTNSAGNGKKLVIIKESFGNAFATWALENYSEVYVVDPRKFNGFGGSKERFNLVDFYNFVHFDDLVIINYPVSVASVGIRQSILDMVNNH